MAKRRWCQRCYLRGTSWLGVLNTVLGCLFNRVIVVARDSDSGVVVDWWWDKATEWPAVDDEGTEDE